MKKYYCKILYTFIGLIVGSILTGLFMFQFISSQRNQGRNEGALNGKREIWKFLGKNIKNDSLNAKLKETGKYYDFKDIRISVIEINGVETIQCK
jgi:hypothetical protein